MKTNALFGFALVAHYLMYGSYQLPTASPKRSLSKKNPAVFTTSLTQKNKRANTAPFIFLNNSNKNVFVFASSLPPTNI